MRHWFPPLMILAGIFTFCLWDASHIYRETRQWQKQLQTSEQLAVKEDWEGALAVLEGSYRDWRSQFLYLHIVTPRDAVDDTEAMYRRASAFAKTREITEFRAELADLQDQLRILSDLESFRLHSIF